MGPTGNNTNYKVILTSCEILHLSAYKVFLIVTCLLNFKTIRSMTYQWYSSIGQTYIQNRVPSSENFVRFANDIEVNFPWLESSRAWVFFENEVQIFVKIVEEVEVT